MRTDNLMTADQQDLVVLGYLRSYFAGTADQTQSTSIAARTTLQLDAVERSLERLHRAGAIEAVIGERSGAPTPVTAVR
jgi:DNA-binding IscR family transcriptional regulator